MKSETKFMLPYLDGTDKKFHIPVYQRAYSWEQKHCKQLLEDVLSVMEKDREKHFFGSIVSCPYAGRSSEKYIIDGQQRITTVSLLLMAIYQLTQNEDLKDKIYNVYIIDKYQKDEKIKLKNITDDQQHYQDIVEGTDINELDHFSRVVANFLYFKNHLEKEAQKYHENNGESKEDFFRKLLKAIGKLEIIDIYLDEKDNPQLIFESLNSTGLALSEADKIRNLILMNLAPEEQKKFYERYWVEIEKNTNASVKQDTSIFIRHYLIMLGGNAKEVKKDSVYQSFKEKLKEWSFKKTIEGVLQELLRYATLYAILLERDKSDKKLYEAVRRINVLETTVSYPYFMIILDRYKKQKMSMQEVLSIFEIIENYVFRRFIVDAPSNVLNKVFAELDYNIMQLKTERKETYCEKLKYFLLYKLEHRAKYPTQDEFMGIFVRRDIYRIAKKKNYIFERLENAHSKEQQDIFTQLESENKKLTIEHIMPQTLTKKWKNDLGKNWEIIKENWLHKLANLTLTGYNSEMSKKEFAEKKKHFSESNLRLNKIFAKYDKWDEDSLKDREEALKKRIKEVWPPLKTTLNIEDGESSVALSDDVDYTKSEPLFFSISGDDYENKSHSWRGLYLDLVKKLHISDSTVLHAIIRKKELKGLLSADKKAIKREAVKIDNNIYLEAHGSANQIVKNINKMLPYFDIEADDVTITLLYKK